jgi:predicted permease
MTAIVTFALGIGATTAVFSLINGVVLRELPVKDPHRLATISSHIAIRQGRLAGFGWSYPMWERLRNRAQAFDGAFVWMPRRLNLAERGEMQLVDAVVTTSDFFSTLGVRAMLGRTFTASDDRRGGGPDGPVTVISHAFWHRHVAGARNVIGMPLVIEGVPFTIVGVTPPSFVGVEVGRSFDVALTFGTEPMIRNGAAMDQPHAFGLIPMLRLKPGQTLEGATESIRALQPEILGPARMPPFVQDPFVLVPAPTGTSAVGLGMSGLRQVYERPLFMVLMIVGVLLIIACANIANLLLIRATTRGRELSIRLALGASRWRLAAQLLVESLVLGVTGALGALLLAGWTTKALVRQMSTIDTSVSLDLPFDWRVLAFTTVVTIITVVLFGVAPAFRAARGAQINPTKAHDRAEHRASWGGPSDGLVMAQVALSLVLLVAAGLLVRTVLHLAAVPLGFDREVLLATVDTRRASIEAETRLMLYERLVNAVSAVAGVEHAAASTSVPIRRGVGVLGVSTPQMPDAQQRTLFNFVSPQWFATYGIPLVAGRDFDARDSANAAPVVIINETLARLVFPGREPLGERVLTQAPNWQSLTVVGVVGDAVSHSLRGTQAGSALRDPVAPTFYVPLAQAEGLRPPGASEITISVPPSAGSASRLAASVGASLTSVDANVSFTLRPLAHVVSAAFTQERLVAMLSGVFGALALFLAGIGLYGVSSYAVSQRRTEIGVRIALGATPRSVVRLILRRVAIFTGLGIIEGVVLSSWVLQVVSSFLFGLSPDDPATLFAAILTVSAIGLAAGWFPAWRAGRIEPVEVLREY